MESKAHGAASKKEYEMISKICSTVMFMVLLLGMSYTSFAAVNVPLIVKEALPASVTGINRTAEIATGGIPLPEDSGITSITQLGLNGVSVGQFRVIGRWPNGNIKWVLLDFPLNLSAGTTSTAVTLVDGTGNFGGSDLAVDNGTTITVSTGAATFIIKKANFNIFDSVTVDATQMVISGNGGRMSMVGTDDVEYSSANDASSTAVIEENGPVRTVVKATGSFKSVGGARLMDYTLRLHFYKGKTTVKSNTELRNANYQYPGSVAFKSAAIIVPTDLGTSKSATFGINGSLNTTSLGTGETAYLFQGYNTKYKTYPEIFMGHSNVNWLPPLPGSGGDLYTFDPNYTGIKIQVGSTTVNAFGTISQYGDSSASVDDSSGKGVTAGMKWLAAFWPGGFEFKEDGTVSIELYSKQNPYNAVKPIRMALWSHDPRTIIWDFHASGGNTNNVAISKQLEYPLLVRAAFTQYVSTKAIYGQLELPTVAEETSFFADISHSERLPSFENQANTYIYREAPGATGGGGNQLNTALNALLDWLRTGYGGWFLKGEQRVVFNNATISPRSDNFTRAFPSSTWVNPNQLLSMGQDWEHMHVSSSPLYYYLTGDESIKEGILDLNDVIVTSTNYPLYPLPASTYLRGFAWKTQLASMGFEFSCETGSCDNRVKSLLETAIGFQIDSRDGGGNTWRSFGRSLDRGYLFWEDPEEMIFGNQSLRHNHSLYDYLYFEGIWQCWRVMKSSWWNYSRLLDMEDYLTGLSQYYFKEWIEATQPGTPAAALNFPYSMQYNTLLDTATSYTHYDGSNLGVYDFGRAASWGYSRTTDQDFLNKGKELVWETPVTGLNSQHELQVQHFIHTYNNSATIPTWKPLPINVTDNGGGSYTLSWTVPTGTTQYQIKYSSKPIVEWLGFNKDTRKYLYDPASYTAFFAASNIVRNPAPATPGTVQTITLSGLPVGQKFSAKYLATPNEPLLPSKSAPRAPVPPVDVRIK